MKIKKSMSAPRKMGAALGLLTATLAPIAQASELATVISSTPILEQISSPVTVCENKQVTVQGKKSGGGALMGAIAGGAVGDAIGEGSGRALATAIGVIGGAVLGDRIEGEPVPTTKTVQDCQQEYRTTTRTKAYRVVYEYAGKRYEVEMANDPGSTLPVQVSPVTSPLSSYGAPTHPETSAATTRIESTHVMVPAHSQVVVAIESAPKRSSPRSIHDFHPHSGHRGHAKRNRDEYERYAWR